MRRRRRRFRFAGSAKPGAAGTTSIGPDGRTADDPADDLSDVRRRFVASQVAGRGIKDQRVVDAMYSVRRDRFVPDDLAEYAYEDRPLPIGMGQTISQPFMVALMADAAEINATDRVLEVGTGSGYGAAVLGHLASEVWTIERLAVLARRADRILTELGYDNVHVVEGDGTLGWPEEAPFDAIVVTAGGPEVPDDLRRQLAEGGRLIIPVGPKLTEQRLLRIVRLGDDFATTDLGAVRFVPLVGEHGVPEG